MPKTFLKILTLSFHGEGAPSGGEGDGGSGAGADGAAADAGQRAEITLESLGVPKAKADKYRAYKNRTADGTGAEAVKTAATGNAPGDPQAERQDAAAERSVSFSDALRKNPQWNAEMQKIVQERVRKTKTENDALRAERDGFSAAEQLLAQKYGAIGEDGNIDRKKLNDAIVADPSFYEAEARRNGVTREQQAKIAQREMLEKRKEAEARKAAENQQIRNHIDSLQQQAAELKKIYPEFDLQTELQNERFFRMTSPQGGATVEEAYFAVHKNELLQKQTQATAQGVRNAMGRSMANGRNIPAENGTVSRASGTIPQKKYSQMNAEERRNFEKIIKSGKKFY